MTGDSYWRRDVELRPTGGDDLPGAAEVVVVGGGITGLLTAVELDRTGVDVAVVEARTVGAGTTGSSTAKVTALHGTTYGRLRRERGAGAARDYGRANLAGLAHLVSTVGRLGIDCDLSTTTASTYVTEEDRLGLVEAEAEAASAAGLDVALVDGLALPVPVLGAVVAPGQAMVDPVRLCRGLADRLRGRGRAVVEGCRVLDVEVADPCVVHTDRGRIRGDRVVVATLAPAVDRTLLFARMEPAMSYALAARLRGPAPDGVHLSADRETRSIRPAASGSDVVVVGGPSHRVGEGGDTRVAAAELHRWTLEHFDVDEVVAEWSAHDVVLSDGVPAIGAVDDDRRLFVASGFRKWGFTHAAATALLVADTLSGRPPDWADLFDPRRAPVGTAGVARTVADGATVAGHLVGDPVRHLAGPRLEDLQPGEAAVLVHDGRPTAARRVENGSFLLLSATCPHLGCRVVWNPAARTWDCPCHGSRFDDEGRVVAGPSNRDLGPA